MRRITVYLKGRVDSSGRGDANKAFAVVCIVRTTTTKTNLTHENYSMDMYKTVICEEYKQHVKLNNSTITQEDHIIINHK